MSTNLDLLGRPPCQLLSRNSGAQGWARTRSVTLSASTMSSAPVRRTPGIDFVKRRAPLSWPGSASVTWNCSVYYYPCDTYPPANCLISITVDGSGVPDNCSLTLAAWCDSTYECWGSPSAYYTTSSSSGTVLGSILVSCSCSTYISGAWRARLSGEWCNCTLGCQNPICEGGFLCTTCYD